MALFRSDALTMPPSNILPVILIFLHNMQKLTWMGASINTVFSLPRLLKPQLGFEVNLIVPDPSFISAAFLPPALTQSVEYLMTEQFPFRLR